MFTEQPFKFRSRRSPIVSTKGVVATSQPLAVAAGLNILRKGGNAADAAVATAAVLNVTEPTSTGIGGDCFALYYDSATGKISALNGSGRAPAGLTIERLRKEGFVDELPPFHPYTITVPGACAGWCDLVAQHGRFTLDQVLEPAIQLAEEGFPVAPITAYFWGRGAERQLKNTFGGTELLIDGRAPYAGERFVNHGLAKTLKLVAEKGKAGFYQDELAEAIVNTVQFAGGCLSIEDLAYHYSTWEEPINVKYHQIRIWECPPNGQGLAALLGLNILEGFDIGGMDALSVDRLHIQIEAMRLAFADARWFVSDPEFGSIPLSELLSKDYAQQRRKLINLERASLDHNRGTPISSSDTVYLSVVDGNGNACSFINSNYMGFGTGIVPSGWGFSLQNRGHNFNLDPAHPNALAPGKRPYHTIIPAMATLNSQSNPNNVDELFACFGVMGGFMQPQGHLQVISGLIDDKLNPQEALDRPRFCITDGSSGGEVALEEGISANVLEGLAKRGHPVRLVIGYDRAIFGRGQIILRSGDDGILWAGSDPRADGCAMSV